MLIQSMSLPHGWVVWREQFMASDRLCGRTLGVPLAWFPRLLHGSLAEREQVRISSRGLHWEALDEDISVVGLLEGLGDQSTHSKDFTA